MAEIITGFAAIGFIVAIIAGIFAKRNEKPSKKSFLIAGVCFVLMMVFVPKDEQKPVNTEASKPTATTPTTKPAEATSEKPKESAKIEVTDDAITFAREVIEEYPEVTDSHITVNGDKVVMAIVVGAATNEETAKNLADSFVRALSSGVSINNSAANLMNPDKDYLGGLWDVYNLQIGVGTGPDDFIVQGAKVKSAKKITW